MSKVTIIGAGAVGEAIANALVIGDTVSDLVFYDVMKEKMRGMVMDFNHGQLFHHTRVIAAEDWLDTAASDIVIITAGVRQKPGESRRDLLGRNKAVMEAIVPNMAKASPNAIVCVVSNPCDFMTQLVAQLSGFPEGRVFGSGTYLDSSRFRSEIAKKLNVLPTRVHAYILGEHGDASVVCTSCALVGGIHLRDLVSDEIIQEAHHKTVTAAANVIALKGYTNTAIGFAVGKIVQAIVKDTNDIIPLSFSAKGRLGIKEDVYVSLPCVIGRNGVKVWDIKLPEEEASKIRASATVMYESAMEVLGATKA